MGFLITEMILFLAGAALLGLIIGWALFGGKKEGASAAAGASTAAAKKAEARVRELEIEREGLSSNLSERDAAIAELAQQMRLAEQNRVEAASKIEQLKTQLGSLKADLQQRDALLASGGGHASDGELARLRRELEELRDAASPDSALVSELKAQVAELRATLESGEQLAPPAGPDDEKDATIARLTEENLGLKANYDAAERSLEEQDGAIDQLTHELLKAQQRIAQLESARVSAPSAGPAPPEPPPLKAMTPKRPPAPPVVEEATIAMAAFEVAEEDLRATMPPLPPEASKAPPQREPKAAAAAAPPTMPLVDPGPAGGDDDDDDEDDKTMVVSKEEVVARARPAAKAAAPEGGPEDLKQIRGIGPAIEKRLYGEGIVTIAQIALLDDAACAELAAAIKVSLDKIRRDEWIEQARSLQASA